jgi:hypothetical protein
MPDRYDQIMDLARTLDGTEVDEPWQKAHQQEFLTTALAITEGRIA